MEENFPGVNERDHWMPSTMTDKRDAKIIHSKILEYQRKVEECKYFHRAERENHIVSADFGAKKQTKKITIVL